MRSGACNEEKKIKFAHNKVMRFEDESEISSEELSLSEQEEIDRVSLVLSF